MFERWVPMSPKAEALWVRHASDGWPEPIDRFRSWHGLFASGWSIALGVSGSYVIRLDATDEELREIYRGSGSFEVEQFDCGFPFGSMRIERWRGDPDSRWFRPTAGHDGWSLEDQAVPRRILPLRFAINTVFYAVILWGLFAAPLALRRRGRIRGGRCPKCAYDLRGSDSPSCPECGLERQAGQSRTEDDKV